MDSVLRRRLEIAFALIIMAIFAVFFIIGLSYPVRPRELPLLVEGAGMVFVLIHLIGVLRKPAEPGAKTGTKWDWRSLAIALGSIVAYLVLAYFIGMILASAVIVYGCGMAFGAKSKVKMAIAAALTVVAVYLVFEKGFALVLYRGIFFGG